MINETIGVCVEYTQSVIELFRFPYDVIVVLILLMSVVIPIYVIFKYKNCRVSLSMSGIGIFACVFVMGVSLLKLIHPCQEQSFKLFLLSLGITLMFSSLGNSIGFLQFIINNWRRTDAKQVVCPDCGKVVHLMKGENEFICPNCGVEFEVCE